MTSRKPKEDFPMTLSSLAGSVLIFSMVAQTPEQPDRWSTIRSAEGDFSAMLPSQASSNTQDVSTPAGKVEQEIHFCRLNGSLFSVQDPARQRNTVRPGCGVAGGGRRRAISRTEPGRRATRLQRDGVFGEEFSYLVLAPRGKGTVTTRTQHYLRGRDYYELTVMSAPDGRCRGGRTILRLVSPRRAGGGRTLGPIAVAFRRYPRSGAREKIADRTPEDALRTFVYAMAVRDEPTLRAITLPVEGFEWLMAGQAAPRA